MRSLVAALLPAALVACAPAEPAAPLPGVEPAEVEALLAESGQVTLGSVERCNNNKDDDGDGLKDGNDPDCKAGGKGGLGLIGDVLEGTGIMPADRVAVKTHDGEWGATYTERGTDGLDKDYSLLTLEIPEGRETLYAYVRITTGEVVGVTPVLLEGDKYGSLVVDVEIDKEIVSYLAYGPIADNVYTDEGAHSSGKK